MSKVATEPKLAPPGAGIPFYQKILLRLIVAPFIAARTTWQDSEERFHKVHKKILEEIKDLNNEQMIQKILVPPQRGLEDSSRFWSVKMTLEHIMIVGRQIYQLVPALSAGHELKDRKADIALLKPKDFLSAAEIISDFEKYRIEEFQKMNQQIQNHSSRTKFYHPWFGMMSAQQWYWLLSIHAGLHLQQIREIKKRLS